MEARIVWDTWRRVLRDETLQTKLFSGSQDFGDSTNFTAQEKEVLAAYSDSADRAKWFVENYQFRLVNSFVNALETGAPLSLRALLNGGLEMPVLSRHFLRHRDWFDYGPNVYSYCRDAIAWLIDQSKILGIGDAVVDILRLEAETVALYLSLRDHAPVSEHQPGTGFVQTGMARLYRSEFELSDWLRDKKKLGLSVPQKKSENLLVVLPTITAQHKYVMLPPRCADLFEALPTDERQITEQDRTHLAKLSAINAISL